ncbi:PREDICTED: uncharacterized protein LOC105146281 [Acromyrmex echinatior]|uniref:uncharacterized protein LOC105146281 n=1 Tax=Acromyrmex echinatior TaxID=103372 RepID=UPI0005810A2E|nr:PREDICTED: uncharacterized protein LOC105146281 [Acromyrmex echinatior]
MPLQKNIKLINWRGLNPKPLPWIRPWTSTVAYGTSAWLSLLYFTDWKAVVRYIPFYGSKFQE